MVQLTAYAPAHQDATLRRIVDFYGHHQALVAGGTQGPGNAPQPADPTPEALAGARETLAGWQAEDHALYTILYEEQPVGFLHLGYRGNTVAWIEDIYVDPPLRGQGIATAAIALAEAQVRGTPGYQAVCIDVTPRNADALRLYHRLGYTGLSLLTLRKDLQPGKRDRALHLLGLDFKY